VVLIPKDWGAGAVRRIPVAVHLLGCICCLCMSGVCSWSPARATLLFHTLLVCRWLAAQHAVRAGKGCSNLAKLALGWQQLMGKVWALRFLQACCRIQWKQRVVPVSQLSVAKTLLARSSMKCLTVIVSRRFGGC